MPPISFILLILALPGIAGTRKLRHENNVVYEIRIYDTAAPGTKATLNEAFDKVMQESKNCFAQLDTDVDWIEFDSGLMMFLTTRDVPSSVQLTQPGTLHLMCASNKMRSINFSIHVTRRNRHPPKFSLPEYRFYVPSVLKPGYEVGRLHVVDHDPIIYNSQVGISILGEQDHWLADKNGSIMIRRSMADLKLFQAVPLQLLAIDYGSPQLFSLVNVTIVPVSVSQPHNVHINIANVEYQIYEWDAPEYGIAEKYRVTVRRRDVVVQQFEVDGQETSALSKLQLPPSSDYTLMVTAMDVEGETPSEDYKFSVIKDDIVCEGECSDGGRPMCFYGKFHKIEQFQDKAGLHCLCFNGFSGPQCDIVENCLSEQVTEAYGYMEWPDTPVNQSAFTRCPYNSDGTKLERQCLWNDRIGQAQWENVSSAEPCKSQSSILIHLGVLATYAQKDAQTVSGMMAVQRFLDTILSFPSFEAHQTSLHNFDAKVAEHAAQVVDTVISRNLTAIPGNISDVQVSFDSYVHRLSKRIPVPYTLESSKDGIQFKTFEWHAGLETYPTTVGRRCYVHMPKSTTTDVVRVICMRNTTLYPILVGDTPVMSIETDLDQNLPLGSKALIGLRPMNHRVNYTCAYFDEKENGWSIAGITVLSRNFENGYVLCETTHLSLFTLLPESLFERKVDWLSNTASILPIISTFISIIVSVCLIFIVVCPRSQSYDAAIVAFLLGVFGLHLVHLIVLTVPYFISLQRYDLHIYLVLEYLILAVSVFLAVITANLDLRIQHAEEDHALTWQPKKACCKLFFAVVVPLACCALSFVFNGIAFYRLPTRKPQFAGCNVAFLSTFVVPLGTALLAAFFYAIHGVWVGKNGIKKTPRWADDRETLIRELTNASVLSMIVVVILYANTALFLLPTSPLRNFLIVAAQISLSSSLFIFVCFLCSVHFGHSTSSVSTGSDFLDNTITSDRRTKDMSRDRLLENTDKSASVSPGNATLYGYRTANSNAGYSTQNSVNSAYSSFKPQLESIYIDETEPSGPLVSIV